MLSESKKALFHDAIAVTLVTRCGAYQSSRTDDFYGDLEQQRANDWVNIVSRRAEIKWRRSCGSIICHPLSARLVSDSWE